jgi:glutathione S-transferase
MLTYVSSELHKNYGPLFNPASAPELRAEKVAALQKRYALIEKQLQGRSYLFGEHFTAADAYLFVVTSWAPKLKVDLSAFPNLTAFQARVAARPAVQTALRAEGLLH